jgi:hypothetical protein
MYRKQSFKVKPAYIQPNNIPETSENTFTFALTSTSVSATCTLSRKQHSQNFSSSEVLTSRITDWNTQEPQTPITMPEHGSTVAFGMLTPQTPSTSFNLNNDVTMDYAGAEVIENIENRGLWGLGNAFTSP